MDDPFLSYPREKPTMSHTTLVAVFVSVCLWSSSFAVPVEQNASGLGAALSSIANSFVVLSDDHHNATDVQTAKPAAVHLESADALPSLAHIALMPQVQHIKAETEELVYTNDTDAQGVVKITIVHEEDISLESTTDTTTERDEENSATTDVITTEIEEPTTIVATSEATSSSVTPAVSTTPAAVLTVLGVGEVDQQKEEEIKENIKEVEAMPVILTVGV
uniref:Uncharacterized protein n=1 Tax=Anopheles farauti TaxID=69004 RepID=A0A182PZL0_9DIPT